MNEPTKIVPNIDILSEAQLRRSTYISVLLAGLLPPFIGGSVMGFMGFYPLPEFYFIFLNYHVLLYVGTVQLLGIMTVPSAVRYIVGLTQLERSVAQDRAKHFFARLPWMLFGAVTLYSIGGALMADFTLEAMNVRHYTVQQHLYNQLGLIPVVLISTYPVFFFFIDRLGRYLGQRGIAAVAIPLWVKILMLGIVTPLLVESTMIGHYLNETNGVSTTTLTLWFMLAAFIISGAWLAWRSLRQSLLPLENFIAYKDGVLTERDSAVLKPLSLDELGVLTNRFAELLFSQQQLSGDLQRSQLLANSVIDNAGALVMVMDANGNIVRFNQACETVTGYTFAEINGKHPWDTVIPPEVAETVRTFAFEALKNNPQALAGRYTNDWIHKNGARTLIDWYNTVLCDADGRMEFMISIGADVSERSRNEEEKSRLAERLKLATQAAQVAIWDCDLVNNNLIWDDRLYEICGLKRENFSNATEAFQIVLHPDDQAYVAEATQRAMISMKPEDLEFRIRRPDGTIRHILAMGKIVQDADGKPIRMTGVNYDITERKQAEQILKTHQQVIKLSNDGFWMVDITTGKITEANPAYAKMSGYTEDELVGMPISQLEALEQSEETKAHIEKIITQGSDHFETRHRHKDGHLMDIDISAVFVPEMQSIAAFFRNITDRKQADAALRISEEKLNEAQRIAHVGSWELDLVAGRLSWSDEIFELFEIDKEKFDATYEAFLNGIHPDDREMVNQAYSNSLVTRAPYEVIHRLKMGDGRIKWVEERCYSEFDTDGKPLRSVGTVQDITRLKKIELDLEQSESLFRTLAQVAPVGIFRTDASGSCIYVNQNYCELAGMSVNAALGNGWTDAIHPDDRALVYEKWNAAVENATLFLLEYRFRRPTGHVTWVVGQARAETGADGKIRGYVGTVTDITHRKHAEEALKRMNEVLEQRVQERTAQLLTAKEEAEQASRTKSLFLASMSHELRTPLNAILGYAQLMEIDQSLSEHTIENAHEIRRAGDYLLALVNDLLDLARIESGRMEMQITDLNLPEVINECCTLNKKLAETRNIELFKDETCNSFKVSADRRRLLQVFNNLVSNAVKYNREGGKVTVRCSTLANGRVRVAVTDTGMGITPEKQAQLFEPFNRLGAEMGKIEGTGIGLVIARKLMENMNGTLGVESTLGTGSTFWLELPASKQAAASVAPEAMQGRGKSPGKFRVLVAEDYAANQVLLKLQLQTLGFEVDIAANGAIALEKWRATRHDLILTDLNMPVMDGPALARAVREFELDIGGRTPIIAITAAAVRAELQRCRDAGMDDVLTKPIALESLRGILSRWLGNTSLPEIAIPAAQESNADAVLDIAQLYRILGRVSLEQAQELVATFIGAAREGLDALAQSGDAEAISREMHKLKSSARTVGAMRFAKLAETLEKHSKENKSSDTVAMLSEVLSGALAELRRALNEVQAAAPNLHLDAQTFMHQLHPADLPRVNCGSVLVVDDDLVVLQQMSAMLTTLGVTEVLIANNGLEAVKLMSLRSSELEALVCDLNMPEMDGVELIRKISQTGFGGGLILMSGADEKVLSTVSKLAGLQGVRVLGQLQKPVMPHQISQLLSRTVEAAKPKRPAFVAPVVTRDDILAAMAANEFSVWFQPKVDALNLRPAGLEALARWRRADGKFVPPDIFITVAEHEGVIGELSKVLVVSALQEAAKLHASGHPLKTAINLSGRWLNDLSLPEYILDNTLKVGLRAEDIILEVTETGVMEDMTTALDVLTRMRIKGFGLSIDDFGIGYSSFEQLGRIPFTELKLDRSFVNRGIQDVAAMAILESSMDMARKLGLSTVAEGVETEAELELIRSLGCDRVQGYFVAKPMPPDELLVWLQSR